MLCSPRALQLRVAHRRRRRCFSGRLVCLLLPLHCCPAAAAGRPSSRLLSSPFEPAHGRSSGLKRRRRAWSAAAVLGRSHPGRCRPGPSSSASRPLPVAGRPPADLPSSVAAAARRRTPSGRCLSPAALRPLSGRPPAAPLVPAIRPCVYRSRQLCPI